MLKTNYCLANSNKNQFPYSEENHKLLSFWYATQTKPRDDHKGTTYSSWCVPQGEYHPLE